jgi:hypothetical protein
MNNNFSLVSEILQEKAVSKSQQRFFGMVRSVQKGDMKAPSKKISDAAKNVKPSEVKKYASTSRKGLPERKKKSD